MTRFLFTSMLSSLLVLGACAKTEEPVDAVAAPVEQPAAEINVNRARIKLLDARYYIDQALAELPEDPAYQDPHAAAEQATDATFSTAAALGYLPAP